MRLLFILLGLPFWVFLIAAGGFAYLGELSYRDTLAQNQEMEQALAGPPPETVSFAEFSRDSNVGLADEVSVLGVINPDYNYELTKRRKGPDTVRFMFVLFDLNDPLDTKVARGALVLTPAEKEKFINEYYYENSELAFTEDDAFSVITLNGQVESSPDLASLVSDSFKDEGLSKADNFIYIEPFLEGREAGLTPMATADEMRNIFRGIALVMALIGGVKFMRWRKRRAAPVEAQVEGANVQVPLAEAAVASAPVAAPAPMQIEAEERPDAEAQPTRKPGMLVKVLAAVAVVIALIYLGYFVYAVIVALVALQILAVRKTGGVIRRGLARLGLGSPDADKGDDAPKTDLSGLMARLKRKGGDDAVEDTPAPAAPKVATPPKKAADPQPEAEKERFSLQLLIARLMPAPREPKIFADRPDPYEKLAAESRRSATR